MAITYKIVYSPKAEEAIEKALDYFIVEKDNLSYAVKLQLAIMDAVEKAAKMPSAGQLETRFQSKSGTTYRKVRALKYYVVYETREVAKDIVIVTVYHIQAGPDFLKEDLP
jgi:plasmid stabilization system protein ParE